MYGIALERSPLADSSKTKYQSRLRGYLIWLADADADALDGDPPTESIAATGAVRDFRRHLKNGRRAPNTIDTYLSAIDDFYARRGLGKPQAQRERDSRRTAPAATSSSPPPRATNLWRCCRITRACASPKSWASTWPTCACQPARGVAHLRQGSRRRQNPPPTRPLRPTPGPSGLASRPRRLEWRRHYRGVPQPPRRPPLDALITDH